MDAKYKELYDLSLKILTEEQQRAARLDEKASRYFSVLSFLVGIYGFFGAKIVKDCIPLNEKIIDCGLIIMGGLIFVGLVVAWLLCFAVFRQHVIVKVPLNDDMLSFFRNNRLIDIYYAISKANKDAYVENKNVGDRKSKLLSYTYKVLTFVLLVLISMMVLYASKVWIMETNRSEVLKWLTRIIV